MRHLLLGAAAIVLLCGTMTSCVTPGTARGTDRGVAKTLPAFRMKSDAVLRRNQVIAMEQPGNYYIARRWYTEGTRYWGYLRKPQQPWSEARLIVINESLCHQPDRVQEVPETGGRAHGYDHNHEYKFWGNYSSQKIYDPNSNLILPEFRLKRYELISANPGFLFYPGEPYQKRGLPPKHPPKP